MAGWHHSCSGHKLGQTLGDGEGQRGLACCSPRGHRVRTQPELNNNNYYLGNLVFSNLKRQPDTLSVGCIGSGLRPFRGIRACGFRPQLYLC